MRSALIIGIAVCVCCGAVRAADEGKIVWQIGETNHDFHDLANAADPMGYLKAFPKDVNFIVGKSDAAKDFSAIQPGPRDHWAERREHPFVINFDLPEAAAGGYELRIDLVDTHAASPPRLRVRVNDQQTDQSLEAGVGDITLLHPEKGKARQLRFLLGGAGLKATGNRIELRCVDSSWLLYDSISLRQLPADAHVALVIAAKPTIFWIEKEGKLQQEVSVSVSEVTGDDPVTVDVNAGMDKLGTFTLGKATLGRISGPVYVDGAEKPRQLTVRVTVGKQAGMASETQVPIRKWRIYCAPATHTDIGYTDIQEQVIDVHNRNTDLALEIIAEFPLYHWNMESSWAAQMWLRDRLPYLHEKLYQASAQHRMGIESGYLNMLTGLCSEEEMIRDLYYSARLAREHGVPFESHTLTDAPSHVWTIPSILAGAGIRCLSVGVNQTRAPLFKKQINKKCPFWWEGPDGQRVLTWFTDGYSQAGQIGLNEGADHMHHAIGTLLNRWEKRDDYPYDAVLLHGAYSDNVAIGRNMAESLTEYSKRYAYPKVVLCANNSFFEYIEQNFKDKIPTVRGCGGSWWEDGAGSSAVETGINRVVHQDAIAAESAWAAATGLNTPADFPQAKFDRVWDNTLLYDEHTWGAHNSISDPTSDFVQRQWAVKAEYATDAARDTEHLLEYGLMELAARVEGADGSLLVFNPAGRARTGVVRTKIPRGSLIMDDGKPVPQQVVFQEALNEVTVAFVAADVPAVGYRVFQVSPAGSNKAQETPKRFDGKVLENDFYRVTFDAATGTVASILDKKLNKELVDSAAAYKFGQLVYAAGGGDNGRTQVECPNLKAVKFSSPKDGSVQPGAAGSVYSSAKLFSKLDQFQHIETEVILYESERRVDFFYRLNKKMIYEKEAVYLAFPVGGKNPKFRYEIGGGNVRPNEDHFPGACRDWFAVQRWVTVQSDGAAVAWSPVDTPLITLCDMTPGKWLDELPLTNGTIFAYTMNNYWFTNYKAGQDGFFQFRYGLTSDAAIDPAAASLFGEDSVAPMRVTRLFAGRKPMLPSSKSFCKVEPANVTLTAVKRADDGKGLILRVRETGGKATDARITTAFGDVKQASKCDLVERVKDKLPIESGRISLKLGPYAMTTIRLE